MGAGKSMEQLSSRQMEKPLTLPGSTEIIAVQSNPERHMGTMDITGKVVQNDYNKTVVGWVDATGQAYRNDFNLTNVGRVDLSSGQIYSANYNKTLLGRVDSDGNIYFSKDVVHASLQETVVGKLRGPKESYYFAACAFLTLWG